MKQTARIIRNNVPYTLLPDGVTYGEPVHVPTVALVRALPDTPPPCITVGSTGAAVSGSFYWDSLSVGVDDGVNFIKLASLVTGRYRPVTVGSGGPPTGAAGTDVTGSYPSGLTVSAVRGTAIGTAGGAHATGRVLRTTGTATADWGALDLANSNATTNQLPLSKLPQSGAVDGYALKWSDASGQYVPAAVGAVGSGTVLPGNVGQSLDTVSGPVAAWVTTRLGTYDDLRAPSVFGLQDPASVVLVQCREDINDGGGGLFAYDPSDTTTADNDGTVLVGAGGERFKRIYSGALNVRWFGAIGDDVANDTAAIQATLDAVPNGGAVYFPPGTYSITGPDGDEALDFAANNVHIYGDGDASVIHVLDDGWQTPDPVAAFDALVIRGTGCLVDHLKFVGDNDPFGGIVNSEIEQRTCILFLGNENAVDNCKFLNLFGHVVQDYRGTTGEKNNVTNCYVFECANGINVNCNDSKQTGNHLEYTNGIEALGHRIVVANNTFRNGSGIALGGGELIDDCSVFGNTLTNVTLGHGIIVSSVRRAIVDGNLINGVEEHGITITDFDPVLYPSSDCLVQNNIVNKPAGTGHGIWCQTGAGSIIKGNRVTTASGSAVLAEVDDVTIDGNVLDGATSDLALQTGQRIRVGDANSLVNGTYTVGGATLPSFTQGGYTQVVTVAGPTNIDRHATTVKIAMNGACAIVLPDQAKVNHRKRITVINVFGQLGTTTITSAVGTIDGAASFTLTGEYRSTTFESDGLNVYHIIGGSDRVPTTRTLTGTTPIRIDGDNSAHDLSANRTISVIEATTEALGVIILTGDLGGTAATPEVQGLYGATVPVGAGLTTGHVLQVTGAAALGYEKVPVLLTETISTPPLFNAAAWSFVTGNNSGLIQSVTAGGDKCAFILDLPEGYTLTDLEVWIQPPGAHGALPATMPLFTLTRVDRNTGVATLIDTETDASASVGAYETYHSIQMGGLAEVINRATRKYVLNFVAEADANALAGTTIGMIARTVEP